VCVCVRVRVCGGVCVRMLKALSAANSTKFGMSISISRFFEQFSCVDTCSHMCVCVRVSARVCVHACVCVSACMHIYVYDL